MSCSLPEFFYFKFNEINSIHSLQEICTLAIIRDILGQKWLTFELKISLLHLKDFNKSVNTNLCLSSMILWAEETLMLYNEETQHYLQEQKYL